MYVFVWCRHIHVRMQLVLSFHQETQGLNFDPRVCTVSIFILSILLILNLNFLILFPCQEEVNPRHRPEVRTQ